VDDHDEPVGFAVADVIDGDGYARVCMRRDLIADGPPGT
jgi:hypothetical protein